MRLYWLAGMTRYLFWILFVSVFILPSCSEYRDHYDSEYAHYRDGGYIESSWWSLRFTLLPSKKVSEDLVDSFDSAKQRIWVEIYTWTEKKTIEAIIRAYRRWVDTRVILEGNVYSTPRINDDTYSLLQDVWVPVVFSDNVKYAFTHAKYWIIDDAYCISSWNFTTSSFQKNRDIIVCDTSLQILDILTTIFQADEKKQRPVFPWTLHSNIAISPINMRKRLREAILGTKTSIYIFVQSVSDRELLDLLEEKYRSWVIVKLCRAANNGDELLSEYSFPIVSVKKPYIHIKALLIDKKTVLVGSVNLTENSIENNREIALVYQDSPFLYNSIEDTFFHDCFPQKFAK